MQYWIAIDENDEGDLVVGPYPDADAAVRALDSMYIDSLLQPSGGGGTDCYVIDDNDSSVLTRVAHLLTGPEYDHEWYRP